MSAIGQLPTALRRARLIAMALPPLPEPEALTVEQGYGLQRQVLRERLEEGEALSGWKVAFAGALAQARFGLSEPVYGALTSGMQVAPDSRVALVQLVQPKLEVEVAFLLGRDIPPGSYSDEQLIAAIGEVAPAFEIADSRWRDWSFEAGAFLADNAAAAMYCLGQGQAFEPGRHADVEYRLEHDGVPCGAGSTAGRADAPLVNLCWLLRRLLADGQPLRAGQVVLSGALLPPLDIRLGEYRLHMLGAELVLGFDAVSPANA
ncbi:2-keto-4-pentenoate hydratase [Pseudomonas sp. R3.Fl]|uniref:2-keto-4-pentenoate hydratase n=1 Tax=Pseudomonas sp. R3.Fl TaxID=2928708 RepID=UPI00201DD38A|nr:2-keto-4-pentenoate hydratase [Pseudomonas sp. R3.Fl]MCL6692982.1 2-keto-4-pentenoate hydratase [Pseudomonas sp. R3.Fl]